MNFQTDDSERTHGQRPRSLTASERQYIRSLFAQEISARQITFARVRDVLKINLALRNLMQEVYPTKQADFVTRRVHDIVKSAYRFKKN